MLVKVRPWPAGSIFAALVKFLKFVKSVVQAQHSHIFSTSVSPTYVHVQGHGQWGANRAVFPPPPFFFLETCKDQNQQLTGVKLAPLSCRLDFASLS